MGLITPNNNEYNLLSNFIIEALSLLGQECKIYTIKNQDIETASDSLIYYDEPFISNILFEDDLRDVKMKDSYWDKETDIELIAYVSLTDLYELKKHCIIEVIPTFYNKESKFIITDIFGQVNTIYARVKLVPYRKSIRTDLTVEDKSTPILEDADGISYRKRILKR